MKHAGKDNIMKGSTELPTQQNEQLSVVCLLLSAVDLITCLGTTNDSTRTICCMVNL